MKPARVVVCVGEVALRGQDGQTGPVVADAVGPVHRGEIPAGEWSGGTDESTSDGGAARAPTR